MTKERKDNKDWTGQKNTIFFILFLRASYHFSYSIIGIVVILLLLITEQYILES